MRIRPFLGVLIGLCVRLWVATLRIRVIDESGVASGPRVLGFWHGQQMPLLALPRPHRFSVLVSLSRDGELQSGVMRALRLFVFRGSSSRGGARGLRCVVRRLRQGFDAVFAVDGPRGPLHQVKPGAASAALMGRARLVPMACAVSSSFQLASTWDRFEVVRPFARVVIVLGQEVDAREAAEDPQALGRSIERAHQTARSILDLPRKEPSRMRSAVRDVSVES